jgi:hypothetical protein
MKKWLSLMLCLLVFCVQVVSGAQAKRVVVDTAEDFLQGEELSVSVNEPGTLSLGPAIARLADLKDLNLWSAVREPRTGDLILGTGPEGEVFRVRPSGKITRLSAFIESDVYAVALGPKGEIYAASSPRGKIFRIQSSGKVEEYFNPKEEFIWSMVTDKKGNLFVATGPAGKIFKVTAQGKGTVYYDSDEPHIRVLAWDKQGALLAGSSENGLLYRITDTQQAVVLLDSEKEEISALAVQPDGTIFAAAIGRRTYPVKESEPTKTEPTQTPASKPSTSFSTASGTSGTTSVSQTPASNRLSVKGESSLLYRLSGSFYPEAVWQGYLPILSLVADGDDVWIGTATEGLLFQYGKNRELRRLGKLDASDITCLLPGQTAGSLFALSSNLGQVFTVNRERSQESTYRSKIIDSQLFSRWGRLNVFGQGKWGLRTRSGNTADPDKSWYPWSALDEGLMQSPPARYLQFEILLHSGWVDRVELSYLPQNQSPVISSLQVLKAGLGYELLSQAAPAAQAQTLDQLQRSPTPAPAHADRLQPVEKKGLRTLVWQASDPNQDELTYHVEIQKEGESSWDLLAEALDKPFFSWDTMGWADGTYYLKVTANDARSNAEGQSLSDTQVSEAWQVDHTPPTIILNKKSSDKIVLEVVDRSSRLVKVEVSKNSRDFQFLQPRDGLLDSGREQFEVKWTGKESLYFRAEDESGNTSGLRVQP